jgi:hypothetical protein
MFKARHFVLATLVMAFSAASALAGPSDGKDATPGKSFTVSWEEFKGRCANPDAYPQQRRPDRITIQCTNVEREFVPDAPGQVDLANGRRVITTVLSDKFNVASMDNGYALAARPGSCLRYKEIEKTISIERPLTCSEVLGIKGEVSDFCASALDTAKGVNPKLIDTHETGNRVDSCGSAGKGGK